MVSGDNLSELGPKLDEENTKGMKKVQEKYKKRKHNSCLNN